MRTLLFIDDDQDFLVSNRLYFSHKGYQVFCCRSPKESLDMLSSAAVDCIILDIDMPDINGFELLMNEMTKDDLIITGNIESVDFEKYE